MLARLQPGSTLSLLVMIFIIDYGNGNMLASRDGDVDRWWWFFFDVCLAMLTETDGRGGVRDVPISVSL